MPEPGSDAIGTEQAPGGAHRRSLMPHLIRPLFAVVMVAVSTLYAVAQQPPSPTRVRGTIESVEGDMLAVKSRSGEDFKLRMASDMRLAGIVKISLSDIKVGSFV